MVEPYQALGLVPTMRGIRHCGEIQVNIEHLSHLIKAASWRFFDVGFILSPEGEVILRHHKVVPLLPVEHSVTPHNVWDRWIELYGRNLDAFYPVADTFGGGSAVIDYRGVRTRADGGLTRVPGRGGHGAGW
jgi:hypothetical protein